MATPQSLQASQIDVQTTSSRLVWVLNRDLVPYKGTFQGDQIVIPPNMEKIPKLVTNGGNLMPYMDARRFIVDLKEPQSFDMDNMGKPQPRFGIKALIDQELTADEVAKFLNKTPTQLKREAVAEEKTAARNLSKELNKARPGKVSFQEEDETTGA